MNRILKDTRLSPNRALLAELLSRHMDCLEGSDEKLFYTTVILTQFGDPKLARWVDREDPKVEDFVSRNDAAQTVLIKDVWSKLGIGSEPVKDTPDAN